ncbi:hypothetical protein QOZ95_001059 [Paenibacillus brasilensis]|uniref:Uncharacterized protein n=1 Tax=Paenibacillus brasilensis TaxID=128574 RepID=A0ABU0KXU4_9BACL|nr:hypothetical protein [Paenibacillus brasilensis]
MFKHHRHHCHFPKPRKRVTKKIIKVTVIKFKPRVKHHRFHEDFFVKKCHHHRKHRHHRHHDCHRRHHKFF